MNSPKFLITVVCVIFSYVLSAQITYEPAFPNVTFSRPVEIQNAQDGTDRMFVVEQIGRIRVFQRDPNILSSQVSTFLDISDRVSFSPGQEIGLLGLAFHPNYAQNGFFYVYYTTTNGTGNFRMVTSRFSVSTTNPNLADTSSEQILFQFDKNQSNSNHNGGKIAFGVDGYLYISIGDGGGANDPMNNSQNISNAFGSICRIDVDVDGNNPVSSNGNYEIPSDNPFASAAGLDEIFAYGIRNTWKFSVDQVTGNIWGADVGQGQFEEINLIENGVNYGWKRFEANAVANPGTTISEPVEFPVFFYDRLQGDISITGGYVYRGSEITSLNPGINSKYIFGDYVSGRVWALDYNPTTGSASRTLLFRTDGEFISSFGLDESGEIYFSDYGNFAQIYKLVDGVSSSSGAAVNGIGEWDAITSNTFNGEVRAVETSPNGLVYIGGDFSIAEDPGINNIAVWSKTNGLINIGSANGTINALKINSSGQLYAGGTFTQIGGISANNIAMWDGSNWNALGAGVEGPVSAISIGGNGNIYVGGSFENLNGSAARNIAFWNGSLWSPLVDSVNAIAGTNNEIRSLAHDASGVLYVGGNFDEAGGNPANRIATWNGSNWGTLGAGTSGFVETIVATDNAVFVGGNFGEAGGQVVNRIARWDKIQDTWNPILDGVNNIVNALLHDGQNLYAAGSFDLANASSSDRIIVNKIVQWNVTEGWRPLGVNTDVGVDTKINAIQFAKDADGINKIYVGGNFTVAGSTSTNDIAQWLFAENLSTSEYDNIIPLRVFPNPTVDAVNLNRDSEWVLLDALGRIINSGYGSRITMAQLKAGVYILNVKNQNSLKIIKQ